MSFAFVLKLLVVDLLYYVQAHFMNVNRNERKEAWPFKLLMLFFRDNANYTSKSTMKTFNIIMYNLPKHTYINADYHYCKKK